jgi:hypothetical protein
MSGLILVTRIRPACRKITAIGVAFFCRGARGRIRAIMPTTRGRADLAEDRAHDFRRVSCGS